MSAAAEAVATFRRQRAACTRLSGSTPTGRNQAARDRAYIRAADEASRAITQLMHAGHRELVGHLTEEQNLMLRLRHARQANQARPELVARLRRTRVDILHLSQ